MNNKRTIKEIEIKIKEEEEVLHKAHSEIESLNNEIKEIRKNRKPRYKITKVRKEINNNIQDCHNLSSLIESLDKIKEDNSQYDPNNIMIEFISTYEGSIYVNMYVVIEEKVLIIWDK